MRFDFAQLDDIQLDPNFENTRGNCGDVSDIKGSVRAIGLTTPLCVREDEDGVFLLRMGFRRFQALRELGASGPRNIPVAILEDDDPEDLDWFRHVAENLQQRPLPFPQQVKIVRYLMDQPGATVASTAAQLNRSENWVRKLFRVGLNLIPEVLVALESEYITEAQARALARFAKVNQLEQLDGMLDPDEREEYLRNLKLTAWKPGVREIRKQLQRIEKYHNGEDKGQSSPPEYDVEYRRGTMAALRWILGSTGDVSALVHPAEGDV